MVKQITIQAITTLDKLVLFQSIHTALKLTAMSNQPAAKLVKVSVKQESTTAF